MHAGEEQTDKKAESYCAKNNVPHSYKEQPSQCTHIHETLSMLTNNYCSKFHNYYIDCRQWNLSFSSLVLSHIKCLGQNPHSVYVLLPHNATFLLVSTPDIASLLSSCCRSSNCVVPSNLVPLYHQIHTHSKVLRLSAIMLSLLLRCF